ncbi:MAG: hypothetical protein ACR2KW_05440 [Rubrobacter sp.]
MKPVEPVSQRCQHFDGLRVFGDAGYLCPSCGKELDEHDLIRWVREAEVARDETYSLKEGDGFREIVLEDRQREVYRRRKIVYGLQQEPRLQTVRPEMILITHDPEGLSYDCRVFYKEPRPSNVADRFAVAAEISAILELRSDQDFVLRIVAGKVAEFHEERTRIMDSGDTAPGRRVFYASEM